MINNILELKTREKIYSIIKEKPGICVRELQRETRFSIGQLSYHLSLILRANLIKETLDKRFRRFYPLETNELEMKILSLLRQNSIRNILTLFLVKNKITNKELSKNIKLSKSTISWYIQNLENFNLLNKEINGNKILYSLKEKQKIQTVLEKYKGAL